MEGCWCWKAAGSSDDGNHGNWWCGFHVADVPADGALLPADESDDEDDPAALLGAQCEFQLLDHPPELLYELVAL